MAEYRKYLSDLGKEAARIIQETAIDRVSNVPGLKMDDAVSDIVTEMRVRWRSVLNAGRNRRKLLEIDSKIQAHTRNQFKIQLKSVLGFDPRLKDPKLAEQSAKFVSDNVKLITSIGEKHFGKVEKHIREASAKGTRVEVLAAQLSRMIKMHDDNGRPINIEARATLIARDQVLKHNANLAKERQVANGVTQYVWRTAQDERVREEHDALDGETFTYGEGTPIGLDPGEDFQCRCYAEPVITADMFGPGPDESSE